MFAQTFWIPKRGCTDAEYEDAFFPPELGEGESERRGIISARYAVTDGATEASFAREWARELAGAYGEGLLGRAKLAAPTLAKVSDRWRSTVSARELPWYAQAKLEFGSYAAIVGASLSMSSGTIQGRWSAWAVGDCCLFHVRGVNLLRSFPLTRSDEFGTRPFLVRTDALPSDLANHVKRASGKFLDGDTFYLMSDAIAHWAITQSSLGQAPWILLADLGTSSDSGDFRTLMESLRSQHLLRNDDTTLTRINIV